MYVETITVDVTRLNLPTSSGPWLTVNNLFNVRSEEEITLCKFGRISDKVNRTFCANSLPFRNVQARRTRFELAKIASHVLEIVRRVKILQEILVFVPIAVVSKM